MTGLVSYGAYVPYHRLRRQGITASLGSGGGKGARAVASYDEDTTSMGVEAARVALNGPIVPSKVRQLWFATTAPTYLDKTNATALHAALGLEEDVLAVDALGSVRSGFGALVAASQSAVPAMAVLSDLRGGLPGGADERQGGDAAAALVFGGRSDLPVLAELLATASTTGEALDRWRTPGAATSHVWEERFGEEVLVPLAEAAFADALKAAGLVPAEVDHLLVAGLHGRAVRRVVAGTGVAASAIGDDLTGEVGNSGAAHAGLLLADALDRAGADETIVVLVIGDGAGAMVLRTTETLLGQRASRPVADQVAEGNDRLSYTTYLSWRGFLEREPPRRPDPVPPAGPPSYRAVDWKFGFVGSRCASCGTRHLPPARVCMSCGSVDEMTTEALGGASGTVATFTVDRLAHTPSPPLLAVVVDLDGGGRFRCQLADATPEELHIGLRVDLTFRRLGVADGVANYFWKARPVRSPRAGLA